MSHELPIENEGLGQVSPRQLAGIMDAARGSQEPDADGTRFGEGLTVYPLDETELDALAQRLQSSQQPDTARETMRGTRAGTVRGLGSFAIAVFNDARTAGERATPFHFDDHMATLYGIARRGAVAAVRAIRPRKPIDQEAAITQFLGSEQGSSLNGSGARPRDIVNSLLFATFRHNLDLQPTTTRLFGRLHIQTREAQLIQNILPTPQKSRLDSAEARWQALEVVAEARKMSPVQYLVWLNQRVLHPSA